MNFSPDLEEQRRLVVLEKADQPLNLDNKEFLEWLGDESWRVRKEAVNQLSKNPDCPLIIPDLINAMTDEANAGLRNSAFSLLIILGPTAVNPLLAAFKTPDEELRKFIIDILGQIPDPRVEPCLLEALNDPCSNVRLSAIEALGNVHVKVAAPALIHLMSENHDPIVLSTTLEALYQLQTPVSLELLPGLVGIPLIGTSLARNLSIAPNADTAKALINIAISDKYGLTTHTAALSCLLPLLEKGLVELPNDKESEGLLANLLEELLNQENIDRRTLAIKLLKYFYTQDLLEKALIHADDTNLAMQLAPILLTYPEEAIIKACDRFDTYPATSQELIISTIGRQNIIACRALILRLIAESGLSPVIQRTVISTMSMIGNEETISALIPLLKGANETSSSQIAAAIINITRRLGRDSQERLKVALQAEPPSKITVELFGKVASAHDLPLVTTWLANENPDVRIAALSALNNFPGQLNLGILSNSLNDPLPMVRLNAIKLIATLWEPQVTDFLLRAIDDDNNEVALAAIEGLSHHLTPTALEALTGLISGNSAEKAISALHMLAGMDEKQLYDALRMAAKSKIKEVVQEAISEVYRLDSDLQADILLPLIKHENWEVRLAALQMIMAMDIPLPEETVRELQATETEPMVLEVLDEMRG